MKKLVYLSVIAILAISCKPKEPPVDPTVKSIVLTPTTMKLSEGQTLKIKATTDPATATVTWSSSDNTVATVDANGNVKALAMGTAVITAKAGDLTATCAVEVLNPLESFNAFLTYTPQMLDDTMCILTWLVPCGGLDYQDGFVGEGFAYYIPTLAKIKNGSYYVLGDYHVYDGIIDASNYETIPRLSFEKGYCIFESGDIVDMGGALLLYLDASSGEDFLIAGVLTGETFTLDLQDGGTTLADLYLPSYHFVIEVPNEAYTALELWAELSNGQGNAPLRQLQAAPVKRLNAVEAQKIESRINKAVKLNKIAK